MTLGHGKPLFDLQNVFEVDDYLCSSATEIQDLLLHSGLILVHLYGDWDGQPLTAESRRMIVIGEKLRA